MSRVALTMAPLCSCSVQCICSVEAISHDSVTPAMTLKLKKHHQI